MHLKRRFNHLAVVCLSNDVKGKPLLPIEIGKLIGCYVWRLQYAANDPLLDLLSV